MVSLGLEARIGSGLVLEVETSARSWERVRVFVAISEVRVALRAWEARSVWRSVRRREWASWAGGVVVGGVVESGVGRVILEKSRSWGECQRTFGISEAHVFGMPIPEFHVSGCQFQKCRKYTLWCASLTQPTRSGCTTRMLRRTYSSKRSKHLSTPFSRRVSSWWMPVLISSASLAL